MPEGNVKICSQRVILQGRNENQPQTSGFTKRLAKGFQGSSSSNSKSDGPYQMLELDIGLIFQTIDSDSGQQSRTFCPANFWAER
jgi:hypothetical protein